MANTTVLIGRKSICAYVGRSWEIVSRWIRERGFPAAKLDDVWESDTVLVDEWRRREIRRGNGKPPEVGGSA